MAKYTHDAIMNTFTEMINEMPFDKITVSELVRRCNISPNTFYYHYKDIYELLGEWLKEGLFRFTQKNQDFSNWKGVLKQALRMCKKHEIATYHIYNSLSRDALERFAFRQSEDVIRSGIEQMSQRFKVQIPEDKLEIIANSCKFMLLGMFLQFVWNKMTEDIDQMVDTFGEMVDDFLASQFIRFSSI